MPDKPTTLVGKVPPAASSLVGADPTTRLQDGDMLPAKDSRSCGEPLMMELMQPLQRSQSEPAVHVRQRQDMVKCRAGGQAAQGPPMASFAARRVLSINNSDVPESLTGTASMMVVQPDLHPRCGHAISKLLDVGLIPGQHLHHDADESSSMNSKSRLALMPLLQDLACAVMAAEQSGTPAHPSDSAGVEQSPRFCR